MKSAVFGAGIISLIALGTTSGRLPFARAAAAQAPAGGNGPARTMPAGSRVAGAVGKKGDTYYWYESQAGKVTARIGDATVVAERGATGGVSVRVHDAKGAEVAQLSATSDALRYTEANGGGTVYALNDSGERPALEWGARQAYALWKTRGASGRSLAWKGGIMQPHEGAAVDADAATSEMTTEWAEGMSVRSGRRTVTVTTSDREGKNKQTLSGKAVSAVLFKDGVEIGRAAWFADQKLFVWNYPGVDNGAVSAAHLTDYGGWPFVPDTTWVHLQAIAFYHFKTTIAREGFVGANRRDRGRSAPGVVARIGEFFAPTLFANDPGCDRFHYLDGTILR
ncbi:MAG TPA: hypothetical protein VFA59_21080, partial [Vicinamibacterales bacterium]|nr:hypothetical protein [Vicinamibacterales bacterium]